jgi:hypothetical protein
MNKSYELGEGLGKYSPFNLLNLGRDGFREHSTFQTIYFCSILTFVFREGKKMLSTVTRTLKKSHKLNLSLLFFSCGTVHT